MDFDDIKKTWKDSFDKNEVLDTKKIEAKLKIKGNSNTALNKIKRNYIVELVIGSVLAIFILFWIFTKVNSDYRIYILAFTTIFFGLILYWAAYNFLKIKNTHISTDQLKTALKQTIKDVERYVNFNKSTFSKYLLLPCSICLGMMIGLLDGTKNISIEDILTTSELIKIGITLVILSAIFIPLSQYYNKKMYKQHLDELKKSLDEFEENEN